MSDIPVFREIWGDSVDYFEPNDEKNMATKILSVVNLPISEFQKKLDKLKNRLDNFSWKKTAEETLKIYEKIYSSKISKPRCVYSSYPSLQLIWNITLAKSV